MPACRPTLCLIPLGLLLWFSAALSALHASELQIERLFGPEIMTGPYKHPARVEELSNGDLLVVYYGGEGEYAIDTGVFASRLKKGGRHWTTPKRIAHDPFRSLGNGVVWQAPDGLGWLFYVVRYGETWSTSRVQAKVSRDNAVTWSDAFPLVSDEGMMVCNKPIVLHNGDSHRTPTRPGRGVATWPRTLTTTLTQWPFKLTTGRFTSFSPRTSARL